MLRGVASTEAGATPSTPGLVTSRTLRWAVNAQAGGSNSWTAMPAALTALFGATRSYTRINLAGYSQCRLVVNKGGTAGAVGSILLVRYALTGAFVPANFLQIGATEVSVPIDTTNVVLESAWIDLVASALADVYVNVFGQGGDGVISPVIAGVNVDFR